MRLATLRRSRNGLPLPGVHGVARVDDVPRVAGRASAGDIAVIEHLDLDAASARQLIAAGVGAVVNAAPSTSGRYPNLGPQVLVEAGVPVLDRVGAEVTRVVRDGDRLRLDGDILFRGTEVVARGDRLSPESVHETMERARWGLTVQLEAFAANTVEQLRQEGDLLLDGEGIPAVATSIAGRPVVVVSCAPGWREDLARLGPWIARTGPVLVGVDEGAEGLMSLGLRPDLVVGNPNLRSDEVLLSGAEIVVPAGRNGPAAELSSAQHAGARTVLFRISGSSEDAALLLVHAHEASLIVSVGSDVALVDFVDRGRADMAATFLIRLKVGPRLVDAAAVAGIYRSPIRLWPLVVLVLLLLGGVIAMGVLAGDATPVGQWRETAVTEIERLLASWS